MAMAKHIVTKNTMAAALKELMTERPFSKISVRDIVERCSMNRNSFYYHFKDKYDLVNWIFYTEIAEEVTQFNAEVMPAWELLNKVFTYFYDNRNFYINALSVSGQNSFEEYFIELMGNIIRVRTMGVFHDDGHKDFYVNFFADALSSAFLRWLKDGATIEPEKMTEMIKKATEGAALYVISERE
ncbi:TetR/AcrR family transcriptional regulator C-terminal domain-containing protein [Tyzzerella sp. OttesenSCG-928-J15]|nr:TetR/AcrR family transcriptional regulator C-terminal domain-containing protein [Tyzzerella sp. OttesenSCG-928-J15]